MLHERDVGFVDFDLGLDHRHVGDRQQHGAGVVHRADDDVLAFFDVAPRDDAVERRLEARLRRDCAGCSSGRLPAGAAVPRASAISCSRARRSLSRTSTSACARSSDSRVVRPPAHSSCCRFRFWRARSRLACALLSDTRDCSSPVRAPATPASSRRTALCGVDRIDLQQELSGLDAVAFVDRQPRHAAHRLGADVDRLLRIDLAGRRDDRLEIALLDALGCDA